MSTPTNDGGPAFPCESYGHRNGKETTVPAQGMTLRDYFAGQALAGAVGFSPSDPFRRYHQPEDVAAACYRFADAMLAAREATK
jgi:hypothetical protein